MQYAGDTSVISVVDDDPSVRVATLDLLQSAGFDCEAFSSGEEYFSSSQIDQTTCLILDLNMGGMSGPVRQRHPDHLHHRLPRGLEPPASPGRRRHLLPHETV
jgi:FixJ family two-component response regulator